MYTLEFTTNEDIMNQFGTKPGYSFMKDKIIRLEKVMTLEKLGKKLRFNTKDEYFVIRPVMTKKIKRYLIVHTHKNIYVFFKVY